MKRKIALMCLLLCCGLLLTSCFQVVRVTDPGLRTTGHFTTATYTPAPEESTTAKTPAVTTTSPPETAPPETEPERSMDEIVRDAFAKYRPGYTLKEVVETEAGFFLFSKLTNPTYAPQLSCERTIDFFDKGTKEFARLQYSYEEDFRERSVFNVLGYALIDDTSLYIYGHGEIFYDSGHRGFPAVTRVSYSDGVLLFDFGKETDLIFYPLAEDGFYSGFNEYEEGFVTLTAAFTSFGGFSLLFDATDPARVKDVFSQPRVNLAYDESARVMTLTCPNVVVDENLLGNVPVSSADPYIQSAKLEKYENGIRATLQLKPEAELYIPWGHGFDRVRHVGNAPGVVFEIEFASKKSVESAELYHIFDNIVYICEEN